MDSRLFLIDGSSFCYRAFYAIRELSTSKGQPTNAVYGVITMLKKLLQTEEPEYIAVAFDLPAPTFRHLKYQDYKKNRPPMPEPLVSQWPWIKEALRAFRIPIFEREGYEADDILGTLARRVQKEGLSVYLVTGDKDMLQLLAPKIKIYRPTRDGYEVVDEAALRQRWSLTPEQVVDVMALMGDESDEIPGVPGIGEKTAVELIQKFGSVEKLLASLETLSGEARRESIASHREQIRLSRELAALDTQVPLEFDLKEMKRQEPDTERLRQLFQELEFRTLLKELGSQQVASSLVVERLDSFEECRKIALKLSRQPQVAVVLSRTGLAVSGRTGHAGVSADPENFPAFTSLLSQPAVEKISPHLKETLLLLKKLGLAEEGTWTDPCLASYLLDPSSPSHEVAHLAQQFLGESIDHPDPLEAAARQAEAALRLMPLLQEELEKRDLTALMTQVELPLARVLATMEFRGIGIDQEALRELSKQMTTTLERLTTEIIRLSGEPFNINSPKQLSRILFEKLKLPVIKRTKTGISTDEEVLRRLAPQHELPAKLLEYREMFKLNSTYVEALPRLIDPKTQRIHTSFNQTVTATGRLSSSNPNLQNIPIRTELGRQIRRAFAPTSPGKVFLAADYSQIELRILAHLSQDQALIQAFEAGADIHRTTAAEIFHVDTEEVSDDQRAAAKTINFGIVYGMTPFGLAKELGTDPAEAEGFIQRYFARYPGVMRYLQESLEQTRKQGYCTTLFNRRRYIPEILSKDLTVRQFAERTAINAPIQGSAADLIKVAMVSIDERIQSEKLSSWMLLTVHDELLFEVPQHELAAMRQLVKETMETPLLAGKPIRLRVPIEVKLKIGRNWLEAS